MGNYGVGISFYIGEECSYGMKWFILGSSGEWWVICIGKLYKLIYEYYLMILGSYILYTINKKNNEFNTL